MTLVMCFHVLLAALAGLLLLERWLDDGRGVAVDDSTGPIDFRSEFIVRWDDEADYARRAACTRPSIAHRPVRRQSTATPVRRSHTR